MTKYDIQSKFNGYRNKEDITNMPRGFLVSGSQNVLTNDAERISIRRGYKLFGEENTQAFGILSSYDWKTNRNKEQHLRSWDDKIEYLAYDTSGNPTWVELASGFSSVVFRYTEFWDTTELIDVLLFVNGTSNIYEWSGATTTFASATVNTITKEGSETWAEEGFYLNGTRAVVIGGTIYTYTGGENTTTLTGVTPDPTLAGYAVGTPIAQAVRTTANSAMTGLPATFRNQYIATLNNQVYIGSGTSRIVYVSQINDYTDYSFSAPRTPGEGATLTLDSTVSGFVPQESVMYITGGLDFWYETELILSSDLASEDLKVKRLKTTGGQAAQSQELIGKIKNNVVFVSHEPTLDQLGRIQNYFATPQTENISDPIKNDFDKLDFTDGQVFYYRDFIYITCPQDSVTLMYNLREKHWEAPQILPIGRFSVIEGELYGHSYAQPETYKMFSGWSDRYIEATNTGNPIDAKAYLSYEHYGVPANLKNMNEFYVEGYIQENTSLEIGIRYEIDGCATDTAYMLNGTDEQVVCIGGNDPSHGKRRHGEWSLAKVDEVDEELPPKFRVIKQFPRTDFYEVQYSFTSNDVDQRWEILRYGPAVDYAQHKSVAIKQ